MPQLEDEICTVLFAYKILTISVQVKEFIIAVSRHTSNLVSGAKKSKGI